MRRGVQQIEPVHRRLSTGGDLQRVLVLEDDDDLRELLSELLVGSGAASCVSAASFEAMVRQREQVLGCGLALLDVNLGPGLPSGLDAYRWLREQSFGGRIVFLTGHARYHPLVRQAHELAQAVVLSKPIDANKLIELVKDSHGPRAP